ncbi:MAG: ABC transporter substrate-binding protein [Melioribacteraceae bacterium]|nr:MAG: ABC transporter substrate-binding protein [Melioribacteraceae bacterium]
MREKIRIASGQGFWGDLIDAPYQQVTAGNIDYLVMDYLAEVTMSILQKQKNKNSNLGYAKDIPPLMHRILPVCKEKNIKVITNGGGVSPLACAEAVMEIARDLNLEDLKIAVVSGDNILTRLDEIFDSGCDLNNMETGEPLQPLKDKVLSANVYFGAKPIVDALAAGADIVITGRTTDTGLTLAPMIHEFGWSMEDNDLTSAGTVAGHILECGGQASGGNLLANWEDVDNLAEIGFPIVEASPDGTFVVTKHEKLGGKVSYETVAEQLVYEIGNPKDYITPDCIADFTSIQLEDEGNNRVKVHGITGFEKTEFYKVSCSFEDGYSAVGSLTYSWPDALKKAKAADKILRKRMENLGLRFDEINTEYVGYNSCHGPLSKQIPEDDLNEVMLRIAVRGQNYKDIDRFGKELAPLILTGPPSVTGFAGGRPRPSDVVAYWPALIPKKLVEPELKILEL